METHIRNLRESVAQLENARKAYKAALLQSDWITQFKEPQRDKAADAAIRVVENKIPLVVRYDDLYDQYMVVGTQYTYLGGYPSQEAADAALKYFL